MFHIVLHEPEIPPNTGNIIRLCANTGATLHLVKPLGFEVDGRSLRRAGLDYHTMVAVTVHEDFVACRQRLAGHRWYAIETGSDRRYDAVCFQAGDVLLFGNETRGLPEGLLEEISANAERISIPMMEGNRSLNLSNAVAIVVYEAWRQCEFKPSVNRTRL